VAAYEFALQHRTAIWQIKKKFKALSSDLNERSRRRWAAAEALSLGWGGIATVSKAIGLARNTIVTGIREISGGKKSGESDSSRIRKPGGGRRKVLQHQPKLKGTLDRILRSTTRGHPMKNIRWTCKSTRNLATELSKVGISISHQTVASVLRGEGYSLQGNRKTKEGQQHPDRNKQFEYIDRKVSAFIEGNQPAISIDTKKKELVGNFKNGGREWRPEKNPLSVNTHDFPEDGVGKAIPYGVYAIARNEGWVSVGITHDTAEFATESIYRWWHEMGRKRYPKAESLMITADAGGSNAARSRLWKVTLQRLADATGLTIHVSHFPPGTSKWNKIEHRLFCFITNNWRGRPLVSYKVVVDLISGTRNSKGLQVKAAIDDNVYETGVRVTDDELNQVKLMPDPFHGDWNYKIRPSK
jgi:transposase